jgi:BirA family biotin operon repressor/biotin-[acetyl-CoA-carboxylase] ligase
MLLNDKQFVILEKVDSTNNYAMAQAHLNYAGHGDAWFALEQTNGKGRHARKWEAENGQNIILSIGIDSRFLQPYQQFQLSATASLGCYDFYKTFEKENVTIKWPNDLFWNDRKAGGILIENIIKGSIWQWAVIGIGININQTKFNDYKIEPVSLKQITGQTYNVVELGKQLHNCIMKRVEELKGGDFKMILEQYDRLLYRRDEKVKLKKSNIIFETTIVGVSETGQLLTFDGIERSFDFDEVEWIS